MVCSRSHLRIEGGPASSCYGSNSTDRTESPADVGRFYLHLRLADDSRSYAKLTLRRQADAAECQAPQAQSGHEESHQDLDQADHDGVAAKDLEKAAADFKIATSKIDKAGARRVLHPNTAARRKSKLARAYSAARRKVEAGVSELHAVRLVPGNGG